MQHNAAHDLHVIRKHVQHAPRRLPDRGKRLRQDLVRRLTLFEARLKPRRLVLELRVGELLHPRSQRVDPAKNPQNRMQLWVPYPLSGCHCVLLPSVCFTLFPDVNKASFFVSSGPLPSVKITCSRHLAAVRYQNPVPLAGSRP